MEAYTSMSTLQPGAGDAMGMSAGQPLVMDGFDQEMPFEDYSLDAVNGAMQPMSFPTSYDFDHLDNFPTTFEDPFSHPALPYDSSVPFPDATTGGGGGGGGGSGAGPLDESSTPEQLDHKLLGFSSPIPKAQLVDDAGRYADVGMSAELYGMFFVAEDVFTGETTGSRPLELTCYRRNLWQCTGQVTLPRAGAAHVVDEQGRRLAVRELAASITAIESIDGKATEIISIPWKSGAGAGAGGEDTSKGVAGAPPHVSLDLAGAQDVDGAGRVVLPVSWKRLQFKHATANNGRRKGLQQHYVVQINLLAKTKSGETIKVAEVQSGPVIVRGRSPRNFDDSKRNVPLVGGAGGGAGEKKLERRTTVTSDGASAAGGSTPGAVKPERGDALAQNMQRYHSLGNVRQAYDWPQAYAVPGSGAHPAKRLAASASSMSPTPQRPPIPAWSSSSSSREGGVPRTPAAGAHHLQPGPSKNAAAARPGSSVPLSLSLSEDEKSPGRASVEAASPQFGKGLAGGGTGSQGGQAPEQEADMLYEYFPLSVDDWLPPVDAIYRPHIVHHTFVPPEVKAAQMGRKTKRYFSAD